MSENERRQQDYEFVMEGITTRMQIALEKMADSNRQMSETNKRLCSALRAMCVTMILVVIIVALGFIADHQLTVRNGVNEKASEVVTDAGARATEAVP